LPELAQIRIFAAQNAFFADTFSMNKTLLNTTVIKLIYTAKRATEKSLLKSKIVKN